jgi:MFS family permease
MVGDVQTYAVCRLIAGIGLAGELGAGITLVSELMPPQSRGIGTTIVAAFGVLGGIAAGFVGGAFGHVVDWTTAYYIGGVMGLALLVLRIGVVESGMFKTTLAKPVSRGNFFKLFTDRRRLGRYVAVICVGVPVWYAIAILMVLSPELGTVLGLDPPPKASLSLTLFYGGASVGSMFCGMVSQWLRSRKRALAISLLITAAVTLAYFTVGGTAHWLFYTLAFVGGAGTGYWAVFVSTAAELFGTNLRATVTTTTPNFVRGSAVLLTVGYKALKDPFGAIGSAAAIGVFSFAIAFLGLATLRETFGVDLDFTEES